MRKGLAGLAVAAAHALGGRGFKAQEKAHQREQLKLRAEQAIDDIGVSILPIAEQIKIARRLLSPNHDAETSRQLTGLMILDKLTEQLKWPSTPPDPKENSGRSPNPPLKP
jgi:hypothetical protein